MSAYSALTGTSPETSEPTTAPTTDGGAITATTRQSTLPSRACRKPAGARRCGRDGDVGARAGSRVARGDEDQRQAQRPQHETERGAGGTRDEGAGER